MGPRPKPDRDFLLGISLVFIVLLPGSVAAADRFQGVVEMRLTMESGSETLRLRVGADKAELRLDAAAGAARPPLRMDIIQDKPAAAASDSLLIIDHTEKTFARISASDAARLAASAAGASPAAGKREEAEYKVKVLGKEKILGHACDHLALTRDQELVDACVTGDLKDVYGALRKLQESNGRPGEAGIFRALDAAGHPGLPMRYTVIREGQKVTTEVTKVEREPVPDSVFSVPKDYRRVGGAVQGTAKP